MSVNQTEPEKLRRGKSIPESVEGEIQDIAIGSGKPRRTPIAEEGSRLTMLVAATKIVNKHLFDGLVVGHEDVADGVSADEVADFLGKILGVVAGAFERLGHEDDLQAGLAMNVLGILNVAEENEIAQAIHFGVGAKNINGLGDFAVGKCGPAIGEHFLEDSRHLGEVAGVFGIEAAADGLSAVGEAEQQVADALETDHEFQDRK